MDYFDTSMNLNSVGGIHMHEDQMTQMVQMLGTVVAQLGRIEQRLDKIEQRMDALEKRMDAIEKRMDALEKRMDALEKRMDALEQRMDALEYRMDALEQRMDLIEQRVGTLEAGASAYEIRFEAIETELRRLRALFEENERTLAIILEVLSNYVKKSEKVDQHDGILIGQRHDLDITQSALKLHIQDKKVHVSPKAGRPKKAHYESEV